MQSGPHVRGRHRRGPSGRDRDPPDRFLPSDRRDPHDARSIPAFPAWASPRCGRASPIRASGFPSWKTARGSRWWAFPSWRRRGRDRARASPASRLPAFRWSERPRPAGALLFTSVARPKSSLRSKSRLPSSSPPIEVDRPTTGVVGDAKYPRRPGRGRGAAEHRLVRAQLLAHDDDAFPVRIGFVADFIAQATGLLEEAVAVLPDEEHVHQLQLQIAPAGLARQWRPSADRRPDRRGHRPCGNRLRRADRPDRA